jgi:hypothetical protein
VNGYANLIGARLRKLADEGDTGVLPVSGHGDGAIFFRGGRVIYAESSRTPLPMPSTIGLAALGLAEVPLEPPESPAAGQGGAGDLVTARSVSRITRTLVVTEAVIDAVADLLSNDSRYAKFRRSDDPPAAQVRPISVETLLAEVQRRHEVLRQFAEVLTPDTEIRREPTLDSPSAQVSQVQWTLLVRAGQGTTPRGLALQLGRSVFGTTIEVSRLIELGLLAVPGRPAAPAADPSARRLGPAVSFIRAVSGERGNDG